jgi:hypothetical protein
LYGTSFGNATNVKNTYTKPRIFNLNSYQQMPANLKNVKAMAGNYGISPVLNNLYNRAISTPNRGNALRESFGVSTPSSSSSSPASSSSNSSSSSAGSAPVRRF